MTIINILEQGMEIKFPGNYYGGHILSSTIDEYESGILLGFKALWRARCSQHLLAKFLVPDGKTLSTTVTPALFNKHSKLNIKSDTFFRDIGTNIAKINSEIKNQPLIVFEDATPIEIYKLERHPEHPNLLYYYNKDKGKIRFPKLDRVMFYKGSYEE